MKNSVSKKSTQLTVFGAGVTKKALEPLLVNGNVLFTAEQLYKGKPPANYKGFQFDYEVVGYNKNAKEKKFTIEYKNRMIKAGGNKWEPDPDGNNEHVPDFTTEQIQDGLELYRQALGRVTKHARDKWPPLIRF